MSSHSKCINSEIADDEAEEGRAKELGNPP
jgi:hypothetical protein